MALVAPRLATAERAALVEVRRQGTVRTVLRRAVGIEDVAQRHAATEPLIAGYMLAEAVGRWLKLGRVALALEWDGLAFSA